MATKQIDVCTIIDMNLADVLALLQSETEVLLTMGNQQLAKFSNVLQEAKKKMRQVPTAIQVEEPLPEGFWLD